MKIQEPNWDDKLQELLLNKVTGLPWAYFRLDLNEVFQTKCSFYIQEEQIQHFFSDIQKNDFGTYAYAGELTQTEILHLLFALIKANPRILIKVLNRLFDVNEITNYSDSDEGRIGRFNQKDRISRNKTFKDKIRKGFRANKEHVVIMAEGDSWFQFPRVYFRIDPVRDIIDWLIDEPNYAVYSQAAGGDWLANIFHSGEYIEELPKISPDVFLLSGGGNDLVGNNRIASMVINPIVQEVRDPENDEQLKYLLNKRKNDPHIDLDKYKLGLTYISNEFFDFLNLYFVQYFIYLYSIVSVDKYAQMLIITQGYDFALPYNENRGFPLSIQRIINEYADTGHWLFEPLSLKAIVDPEKQEAVIYTMIYEFNEMLIQLANFHGLPNLFHIDCRGFAQPEDWFDELHLKSDGFRQIAKVYKKCIKENFRNPKGAKRKVYRVVEDLVG